MDDAPPTFASETLATEPLRLRLQSGGHVFELDRPDMLLGRHSEADLRLPMPDVSRRHCQFTFAAGEWEIIDLGSLNGVYVNGLRVDRSPLHPGDRVRIAGLEFEVDTDSGSADVLRRIAETLPVSAELPQRKAS